MEFFSRRAQEYIDRTAKQSEEKSVPDNSPEAIRANEEVYQPLSEVQWDTEGTVELNTQNSHGLKPDCSVTFEYNDNLDQGRINGLPGSNLNPDNYDEHHPVVNNKTYRQIKNMTVTSGGQRIFQLADLLEDNWEVYAFVGKDSDREMPHGGTVRPDEKFAIAYLDITSPVGLHALLHEIGHLKQIREQARVHRRQSKVREKISLGANISTREQKLVILNERNAEAFALNTLRQILQSQEQLEALKRLAHRSQKAYHQITGALRT